MAGAIQRDTQDQLLNRLLPLVSSSGLNSQVRAQAFMTVQKLDQWLAKQNPDHMEDQWAAHYALARHAINSMNNDPSRTMPDKAIPAPPGSPIGN